MAQLEVRTPQHRGNLTMADGPLGRGGEGAVHSVLDHSIPGLPPAEELVVKIYHRPEEGNRREKVISMVSSPPDSEMFAWPLAIAARGGLFVGYVMRRLQSDRMKEWAHLAHIATRREIAPAFDVRYAIAACLNYAIALDSLHRAGHMQGDANESNSFVGADASVTIVDTDSAQIQGKDGRIFRCEVGKAEYTAPELIGRSLREQDRTVATDAFAFGVLLFQMLTGGGHPTDGVYSGAGEPPSTASKISQGILPMLRDESARGFQPVPRIAAQGIPLKLRRLILALCDSDPAQRTSLERTIAALSDVQSNLEQCTRDEAHWYDGREGSCSWCAVADRGQPDPWGKPRRVQSTLPPVNFSTPSAPTGKAPRRPSSPSPRRPTVNSGPSVPSGQFSHRPTIRPSVGTPPLPNAGAPLTPLAQQLLSQANGQGMTHQGPPQQAAQSAAQVAPQVVPQKPSIPPKIRGKMTVVYPDGSYGPRPRLSALFTRNNRLWRQAVAAEWPGPLKLWWPAERPLAQPLALWLSPILTVVLLVVLVESVSLYAFPSMDARTLQILAPLLLIGSLTSALAFLIWWIGAWIGRSRAKRSYGSLDGLRKENILLTMGRSVLITVAYVLTPVAIALGVLIGLITTAVRGDR